MQLSVCRPDWLGNSTNDYYTRLYCPNQSVELKVGGLLYSSVVTTNPKITISECMNDTALNCTNQQELQDMQSKGRFFLFIEKKSGEFDTLSSSSNFLLYNFFAVHGTYNRIGIQLQVNKEIILPNYLTSFTQKETTRLDIVSVYELNSLVANLSAKAASLLLSVEFTLAPVPKRFIADSARHQNCVLDPYRPSRSVGSTMGCRVRCICGLLPGIQPQEVL